MSLPRYGNVPSKSAHCIKMSVHDHYIIYMQVATVNRNNVNSVSVITP